MENAIKNRIPIDIDFEPHRDEIFSGICIKKNDNIFILVCFNDETKEYDGFAIFRNYEVEKYRYWDKEELNEIKRNNFAEYENVLPISELNTYFDCLNFSKSRELVAIYIEEDSSSYYVGRIVSLNEKEVELKLISEESEWLENITLKIDEITYLGFDSSYEKELIKKAIK